MSTTPLSPDRRNWAAAAYNDHGNRVARMLLKRYPGTDADAVSEAVSFAAVRLAQRPDLPAEGDVGRDYFRLAKTKLRSIFRSRDRRRDREQIYARDGVTTGRGAGPAPDELLERRELADRSRHLMAKTDEELRALDAWACGVTDPKELAPLVGVTPAEAKTILARFRQRQKRLRDNAGPEDEP